MLTLEQVSRPSVDELMIHPINSKNIKEYYVKDKTLSIKRETDKLLNNEQAIKDKE